MRRSRRLSSRAVEVTKQAMVRRSRRLSSRALICARSGRFHGSRRKRRKFGHDRVRRDDRGRGAPSVTSLHGTQLVHRDTHRHALRLIPVKLEGYIVSPRAVRYGQRAGGGAAAVLPKLASAPGGADATCTDMPGARGPLKLGILTLDMLKLGMPGSAPQAERAAQLSTKANARRIIVAPKNCRVA